MASVVQILIASSPTEAPVNVEKVRAVPGLGLEGDRYWKGTGTFLTHPRKADYELTLVQKEHLDAFAAESGLAFGPREARRNIVTCGVDLNELVGREFRIGDVLIRGIRLCEPCNYLAKQTSSEVLRGLVHKGGLRAQILIKGIITVGDSLSYA